MEDSARPGPVRPATPAALPTVELRASVQVDGRDTITVGTVRCPMRCRAEVYVRRGDRHFGVTYESHDGESDIRVKPEKHAATVGPLEVRVQFPGFRVTRSGQVAVED